MLHITGRAKPVGKPSATSPTVDGKFKGFESTSGRRVRAYSPTARAVPLALPAYYLW